MRKVVAHPYQLRRTASHSGVPVRAAISGRCQTSRRRFIVMPFQHATRSIISAFGIGKCRNDDDDDHSDSDNGNRREVAEIILFESRERRKGQEYLLGHYQKLSIQISGWMFAFWLILVFQRDSLPSGAWFGVAATAGVVAVAVSAYTVLPKNWTGPPQIQTMSTHYYDQGRTRSELERSLITNLEKSFNENETRIAKTLCAVRAQSVASPVSVGALIAAVNL